MLSVVTCELKTNALESQPVSIIRVNVMTLMLFSISFVLVGHRKNFTAFIDHESFKYYIVLELLTQNYFPNHCPMCDRLLVKHSVCVSACTYVCVCKLRNMSSSNSAPNYHIKRASTYSESEKFKVPENETHNGIRQ
jgi:hypothetical protein